MPNVMGRDFPYTPEGMTAAQQYSQAMGMRDGGPMGFRPISYANGGPVQGDPERSRVINALAEITGLPPETFSELPDDKLLEFARQVAQQQPQQPQAMPPMEPPMRNLGRITGRGGLMSLSPR